MINRDDQTVPHIFATTLVVPKRVLLTLRTKDSSAWRHLFDAGSDKRKLDSSGRSIVSWGFSTQKSGRQRSETSGNKLIFF